MFGSRWKKAMVTYSQETQWKRHGDMVKLNLYYDSDKGCLVGVKPTYGTTNGIAVRLGTEKTPAKVPVRSKHIQLGPKEKIVSTHWKAGNCIEYFKVSTNQGRFLEIGDKESTAPLKTNKPATGAFLGFFKGFTDVVNSNAATGALQQLQLFWVLRECDEPGRGGDVVTESGPASSSQTTSEESDSSALAKQKASYGLTEDPSGTAGGILDVDIDTSNSIGGAADSSNITAGEALKQTVIVVDQETGDALAVGEPLSGDVSSGGYSSSGSDVAANFTGHPWADSSSSGSGGSGSSNDTDGIKLPFGKKFKVKKALKQLKAGLLAGINGNGTSSNATCSLLDKCPGGACLTPSCALNGAGKDVLTMMCYGTNIIPNPLLDATVGNPCANLACKLHNPNCTSGPLGLGGFCTGTVKRMGYTAKLHPAGAVWEGHPCIEHKGPLLALLPKVAKFVNASGEADGNGAYVSKAWKVCDCINGPGLKPGSLAVALPEHVEAKLNLTAQIISSFLETKVEKMRLSPVVEKITEVVDGIVEALSMFELSLSLPVKEHLPLKSLLPAIEANITEVPGMQQGVLGMQMPDVLAQWATAFATKAQLKKYIVSQSKLNALRAFVPGFEVPSVLVANVSSPLMKPDLQFDMPVFTIPDESLSSVAMLLPNITSLPMLCLPKIMGAEALFNKTGFHALDVHNFTIPSMERVVERLLSIFPPAEWAVSIVSGKFSEVASKWMTGVLVDEQIPVVNVTKEQWGGLHSLLPDLHGNDTALVLWNASSLLFTKPRLSLMDKLNTLVVPAELSANVTSICPLLVPGLPALLMRSDGDNSSTPMLTLGSVTPPDLKMTIDKLVHGIPGHLAFNLTGGSGSSILNFTLPLPLAKLGHFAGIDSMVPGGMGSVLEAFAGFDALKKNLTGLAGLNKNISGDFADQAFVKLVGGNFTGIKGIKFTNFTGLGEQFAAAKAAKKEEGLAALKSLLGPKIAVMKAAKKHKAKILNITLSQ